MSATKSRLENTIGSIADRTKLDEGCLWTAYGEMCDRNMLPDSSADEQVFQSALVRFCCFGSISEKVYLVYEDFIMKKIRRVCRTRKEAQKIKGQYLPHSEVWIEEF